PRARTDCPHSNDRPKRASPAQQVNPAGCPAPGESRPRLAPLWQKMGWTWHHKWFQSGAMNLELYVENINRQLAVAAETGGDQARALAERLVAPLEAAIRLTLQDA